MTGATSGSPSRWASGSEGIDSFPPVIPRPFGHGARITKLANSQRPRSRVEGPNRMVGRPARPDRFAPVPVERPWSGGRRSDRGPKSAAGNLSCVVRAGMGKTSPETTRTEGMMTDASVDVGVSPGTCLDGRYRLHRRHQRTEEFAVWKASDDLLQRTVAVTVFDAAPSPPADAFEAVRAASCVTHAGVAQVFDANQDADPPYVVREWIPGRDLAAMVGDGPLEPQQAARDFRQVSETLATAHAAGVPHLRLTPQSLVWSSVGGVRIVGIGVDAAAAHA